jgi:hypothetical protein
MTDKPITILDDAWTQSTPIGPTPIGVVANTVVEKLRAPRFPLVRMRDIKVNLTSRYLVKGVVASKALIVVWGRPKCGKSFWTFDLAAHVATGISYRGQKVRQGPVVYIAAEGVDGFNARIEAWRAQHLGDSALGHLLTEGTIPFDLLPARLDLVAEHGAFISDVMAQTGNVPPVLVVVDTLNRTYAGSESSDEDMTAYIAAADAIKAAFNCTVIIVHHCGHESSRPRGHSSLTAAADTQIAIRRDGDFVTATVEWNKDGPEGYVNVSRLDVVEVGRDGDGDAVTTRVVVPCEPVEAGMGRGSAPMSPVLTLALQALTMAIAEAGASHNQPHIPDGVLTVAVELWRQYFYKRSIDAAPEAKQETRKKNFQKASRELQARSLVGCWNEHVWIVKRDD